MRSPTVVCQAAFRRILADFSRIFSLQTWLPFGTVPIFFLSQNPLLFLFLYLSFFSEPMLFLFLSISFPFMHPLQSDLRLKPTSSRIQILANSWKFREIHEYSYLPNFPNTDESAEYLSLFVLH